MAFPAFVAAQLEEWQYLSPVPWSFVKNELRWAIDVALIAQLAALLVALARRGVGSPSHGG